MGLNARDFVGREYFIEAAAYPAAATKQKKIVTNQVTIKRIIKAHDLDDAGNQMLEICTTEGLTVETLKECKDGKWIEFKPEVYTAPKKKKKKEYENTEYEKTEVGFHAADAEEIKNALKLQLKLTELMQESQENTAARFKLQPLEELESWEAIKIALQELLEEFNGINKKIKISKSGLKALITERTNLSRKIEVMVLPIAAQLKDPAANQFEEEKSESLMQVLCRQLEGKPFFKLHQGFFGENEEEKKLAGENLELQLKEYMHADVATGIVKEFLEQQANQSLEPALA